MGLFWKDPKQDVHHAMIRILNESASFSAPLPTDDNDQRADSRSRRTIPVIILPLGDESSAALGFTQDVSREGVSLLSMEALPVGEFAIAFEQDNGFMVFQCDCVQQLPMGLGCFLNGIRVIGLLPTKDFELLNNGEWRKAIPPQLSPLEVN